MRETSKGEKEPAILAEELQLLISQRRAQQLLNNSEHFKYRNAENAPLLTLFHRQNRLKWIRKKRGWNMQK